MIVSRILQVIIALLAVSRIPRCIAVDEGPHEEDGVGVYVYKSIAPYDRHVKNFIEKYNGAHYYAQTKYSSDYWNAIGTIDLSEISLNLSTVNGENRVACIALNVLTEKGAVDLGIENAGDGWFAMFYAGFLDVSDQSPEYKQPGSDDRALYPTATRVTFSIDAEIQNEQDRVFGYFSFYDRYWRLLGQEQLVFHVPEGGLYNKDDDGLPMLRFSRFMSLLPHAADNTAAKDVADHSYMRNAEFTGLQLYDRYQGYRPWNMDRIDFAWSVQTANIEYLAISPQNSGIDVISIFHSHDYHNN